MIHEKYKKILDLLYQHFPEFANSIKLKEHDKDLSLQIFATFGEYLDNLVQASPNPFEDTEVIEVCNFVNEMGQVKNMDIRDQLEIRDFLDAFFKEIVKKQGQTLNVLKKLLNGSSAIALLNQESLHLLYQRFPEFANSKELEEGYDKNLPYLVYAGFGAYFSQLVERSEAPQKDEQVIRVCNFVNEMARSDDKRIMDLLIAGFFESVCGGSGNSEKGIHILEKCLNEPARTYLKDFMEWKPSNTIHGVGEH